MNEVLSTHTIRTGNLAHDQQQLQQAQHYAQVNGLLCQVTPLPHGGFEVSMMRPAPPPLPGFGQAHPGAAPLPGRLGAPPGYGPQPGYGPPVSPGGSAPPHASFGGAAAPLASISPPPNNVRIPAGTCGICRRHAPTQQVTFYQNIGALVLRFPRVLRGQLCRDCVGKYFRKYTLTSLFLGWWGIISFFYTLITIPMNVVQYLQARSLPRA